MKREPSRGLSPGTPGLQAGEDVSRRVRLLLALTALAAAAATATLAVLLWRETLG